MAGYRKTSKSLLGMSKSRRVKTTTIGIYVWQFEYANIIPTVLCMSIDLMCHYITDIHNKRIFMSCFICNMPWSNGILLLLSSILCTGYYVMLYAQVTLYVMWFQASLKVNYIIMWNNAGVSYIFMCDWLHEETTDKGRNNKHNFVASLR